jgi:hypothetical protein
LWLDAWEHPVCWWDGDVAMSHEPMKRSMTRQREVVAA